MTLFILYSLFIHKIHLHKKKYRFYFHLYCFSCLLMIVIPSFFYYIIILFFIFLFFFSFFPCSCYFLCLYRINDFFLFSFDCFQLFLFQNIEYSYARAIRLVVSIRDNSRDSLVGSNK